ncbi:MAG TPA: hypothetical protein VM186_06545 [Planctomycetota bacterium]|nr:hypothetical protein [Planctomycetota bacterium]
MAKDPATLTRLDELIAAIRSCGDPRRASAEWKQVYRLLQQTGLPAARVTHVVGMRDVAGLAGLIDQLREPAPAAPPPADVPDAETCKRAMRAFRKRLALIRLDDESKISSRSPLSKGADRAVTNAIIPPNEWPEAVWQELARQGKLVHIGHGFYELPKQ